MGIRTGCNEQDYIKNLLRMSLKAIIADVLHVDLDEMTESDRLVDDLHMGASEGKKLKRLLAEVFNGLQVDLQQNSIVADILNQVEMNEFRGQLH